MLYRVDSEEMLGTLKQQKLAHLCELHELTMRSDSHANYFFGFSQNVGTCGQSEFVCMYVRF